MRVHSVSGVKDVLFSEARILCIYTTETIVFGNNKTEGMTQNDTVLSCSFLSKARGMPRDKIVRVDLSNQTVVP